jgi:hypothetical protein
MSNCVVRRRWCSGCSYAVAAGTISCITVIDCHSFVYCSVFYCVVLCSTILYCTVLCSVIVQPMNALLILK